MSLPDLSDPREVAACTPLPLQAAGLNPQVVLPFGCTKEAVLEAMQEFVAFLAAVNQLQRSRNAHRLENLLAPATFSSVISDFLIGALPRYCTTLVKNCYHNGHPDLIPAGKYPRDAVQHGPEGIEVKASRRSSGWQGHNEEDCWLLVFMYDGNRPSDHAEGVAPKPFQFTEVIGAGITKEDWRFQSRSEDSRRTPTAGVLASGAEKMRMNWVYRVSAATGLVGQAPPC